MINLIRERISNQSWPDEEQRNLWMGTAFLVDFDFHRDLVSAFAEEDKTRLWSLRAMASPDTEQGEYWPQLTPAQNHFLVTKFGSLWPPVDSPRSGSGDQNPWDASQFIQARINALATDLSDQATVLLSSLVNSEGLEGYQSQIKHVLAQQIRRRAEEHKGIQSFLGVRSILLKGEPANIDDLQALVMDELEQLQRRLKDGATNGVLPFWNGSRPHYENYCRDRIVEHLSPYLEQKFNIRSHTEGTMPDNNRCDFLNTHGAMDLPVEVKGQWHSEVWTVALNQLQNYTREYRAEGRGIYLVLWFGKVGTGDSRNPHGWGDQPAPRTAQEMESLLYEKYRKNLSERTKIFVLDVSKPNK